MGLFASRARLPVYAVTLALDGRHPYRTEKEFQRPDSTATVYVHAKSWNDAAKQATNPDVLCKLTFWAASVTEIKREGRLP